MQNISYGRNVDNTYHHSINNTELENIESIKDLVSHLIHA